MRKFKEKVQGRYTVVELNPEFFAKATQQSLLSTGDKMLMMSLDSLMAKLRDERATYELAEQPNVKITFSK